MVIITARGARKKNVPIIIREYHHSPLIENTIIATKATIRDIAESKV